MKRKLVDNKPLLILLIVFYLANLFDMVSTRFIVCGESNPIWLFTGGNMILTVSLKVLLPLLLIVLIARDYRRKKLHSKFFYVLVATIVFATGAFLTAGFVNLASIDKASCDTTDTYVYVNETKPVVNESTGVVENVTETERELAVSDNERDSRIWNYLITSLVIYIIPLTLSLVSFGIYDYTMKKFEKENKDKGGYE